MSARQFNIRDTGIVDIHESQLCHVSEVNISQLGVSEVEYCERHISIVCINSTFTTCISLNWSDDEVTAYCISLNSDTTTLPIDTDSRYCVGTQNHSSLTVLKSSKRSQLVMRHICSLNERGL